MPEIRIIHSLDAPELQPYRTLRRPQDHRDAGIFVAEGGKVVQRMLAAGIDVLSLLLTREWLERLQPQGDFPVYVAEQPLLESIVGFPLHQGVMGIGRIPAQPSLMDLLKAKPARCLYVALDRLEHAENVGVVVRNAAAFGVNAVIHDARSSSPFLRRAVRNSMGAVFQLKIVEAPELAAALMELRAAGFEVVAADPRGGELLQSAQHGSDICVVLGNEGAGISDEVLQACTRRVSIPMMNNTDSLNVASASAVFLYELSRKK